MFSYFLQLIIDEFLVNVHWYDVPPNCQIWLNIYICPLSMKWGNIYRITAILRVETDIIVNISVSPIGLAMIFVILSVETFKTKVIVFICEVRMCFTSDWPKHFVDQDQFSDTDFISGIHQRENVQFADNCFYM